MHNDPLIGVTRADQLVPDFFPDDFPHPGIFRSLRFDEAEDVRDQTQRMITLAQRKSGYQNILFLLDEAVVCRAAWRVDSEPRRLARNLRNWARDVDRRDWSADAGGNCGTVGLQLR